MKEGQEFCLDFLVRCICKIAKRSD